MILSASRGKPFTEVFNFKDAGGGLLSVPSGEYKVHLERAGFVRYYNNLGRVGHGLAWNISKEELDSFPYSTLYFSLLYNGEEIARGVLRVE